MGAQKVLAQQVSLHLPPSHPHESGSGEGGAWTRENVYHWSQVTTQAQVGRQLMGAHVGTPGSSDCAQRGPPSSTLSHAWPGV